MASVSPFNELLKRLRLSDTPQISKRMLLATLAMVPFRASAAVNDAESSLRHKFRGIAGVVVVLDVAKGAADKRYVTFTADTGRHIAAPSSMVQGGRGNLGFTGGVLPVPMTVHVTWRQADPSRPDDPPRGGATLGHWMGGALVGDYVVEVANRIPDAVLDYIRAGGRRALRLKFRLKDDGVLFGWDVEETYTTQYGTGLRYQFSGGDFLDTHY
jgi:hypothetical protein